MKKATLSVDEKRPTGGSNMRKNLKKGWALIGFSAFVIAAFGFQSTPDHKVLFEKAKYTMESKGDLQEAIKLFNEIIAKFPEEREYAARSQFLIGECYEKMGKSSAIEAYERVEKNYADQTELVSAARSRLTSLQARKSDIVTVTTLSTGYPYLEAGTLSPDGMRMAGVSYETGQNIAVMNVGENKVTQVTQFGWNQEGGWTYYPVWSPDGKEIAFMFGGYKKPVELRTTTLDGKQRTLYTCAKDESIQPQEWLPTGEAILCGLYRSDGFTLGLVSVRDGSFRSLRKFPQETSGSSSPNGRYVVFHEGEIGSRNLSIMSIDGKSYKALTKGPSDERRPLWSPDGKHIVFLSYRHGGWALWGIEVDRDGDPKGSPFLIRDGMQNDDLRNWTNSGLYCQKMIDTRDVFVMPVDPKNGSPKGKPRQIAYAPTGNNKCPTWSHDGKWLAFVSHSEDYPNQGYVVVMPAAGGDAKKFPVPSRNFSAFSFHDLKWRPDSKAIGMLCWNNDGEQTFFVVNPANGEWQSWTLSRDYDDRTRMEWKGDGRSIYLSQQGVSNKDAGIVECNLETGEERYIYRAKAADKGQGTVFRSLTCSRDYSKLAIMDKNLLLVVIDARTGKVLREFSRKEGMANFSAAWSPDGNRLFVRHSDDPKKDKIRNYSVLSMEDESEEIFEFPEIPLGLGQPAYFDWSVDGARMVFSARSIKYEVFLLSNIIPPNK